MKQFRYNLQTVLNYKNQVLDDLKIQHAAAADLVVAFRAKCKMFSRHLQKPILKTEKGRFKGL